MQDRFGADELVRAVRAYAGALAGHRELLNRLNVFPVPDGDTGTNMALTVDAALAELDRRDLADLPSEDQGAAAAEAIAYGTLMGARGNSGVILCQVLRALSQGIANDPDVDRGRVLAEALAAASEAARAAVMRPAEGTILTVVAAAAEGAKDAAKDPGGLLAVLESARDHAVEALWRTPELLPVLAEAGVVDAGGAGLTLLLDSLLVAADGRAPSRLALPEGMEGRLAGGGSGVGGRAGADADARSTAGVAGGTGGGARAGGPMELRYEVMYLLEAPDASIPGFRDAWATIGDSIVVVGGDGMWSCHIHTDDIGAALEAALDVGRPRQIRVTDLAEQVEEELWVRQAGDEAPAPPPPGPPPRTSVVAVANGDGVRRIFRSLGVSAFVEGGQSMNPSTAELLSAVEETPGGEVVILPNNGNIVPVANQVVAAATKPVVVVPTKGIQEGFAALLEYDPQEGAEENAREMGEAASRIVAGEVTRAVRAAETAAGHVEPGDFIGLTRTGVEARGSNLVQATCALLDRLLRPDHEIVTLIEGADARPGDTRAVTEWLRADHPGVDVEQHRGGQPLYPYLVSIE